MSHTHERASIQLLVDGLDVQPEAVRFACNYAKIRIQPDGWFLLPVAGAQRDRFFAALASRPQNAAERLLWDLGARTRRMIVE